MNFKLFLYGLAAWLVATIMFRIAGQHILNSSHVIGTLVVFAVTFPLMAWIARFACGRLKLDREQWPRCSFAYATHIGT